VSIKEAKDRLPALAREAEGGERIVITRNGRPVVDLVPHRQGAGIRWDAIHKFREERGIERIFGEMSPDFDDPLPEDVLLRPLP
jgi:prevent-host-death family protein